MVLKVKTQKSTNNLMSIFGLIEEDMELSHIYLAVIETWSTFQDSSISLARQNHTANIYSGKWDTRKKCKSYKYLP